MHKVYYQPEGIWVGDIMPYGEDGTFYLYHQRDTRNPEPFGEPFGWALATTKDFVNYKDFGESLERGGDEEVDQYIYAGTVFKVGDKYHALYTGCNRDKVRARLMKQVLLHATSDDAVKNISQDVIAVFTAEIAGINADAYVGELNSGSCALAVCNLNDIHRSRNLNCVNKRELSAINVRSNKAVFIIITEVSDSFRERNRCAGQCLACLSLCVKAKCLSLGQNELNRDGFLCFADLLQLKDYGIGVAFSLHSFAGKSPCRYNRQNHTHSKYDSDYP